MLIRRERPGDPAEAAAVRAVVAAAFVDPGIPGRAPSDGSLEADLVDALRADDAWLPPLALVAEEPDRPGVVVGHVVCSRAWVGEADEPVLALGPVAVAPDRQRAGVGSALVHAVLGAADALGEPLVVLLGHLDYYPRFGFRPAAELGIVPPVPEWAAHFQARPLSAYRPELRGPFRYAAPFNA